MLESLGFQDVGAAVGKLARGLERRGTMQSGISGSRDPPIAVQSKAGSATPLNAAPDAARGIGERKLVTILGPRMIAAGGSKYWERRHLACSAASAASGGVSSRRRAGGTPALPVLCSHFHALSTDSSEPVTLALTLYKVPLLASSFLHRELKCPRRQRRSSGKDERPNRTAAGFQATPARPA